MEPWVAHPVNRALTLAVVSALVFYGMDRYYAWRRRRTAARFHELLRQVCTGRLAQHLIPRWNQAARALAIPGEPPPIIVVPRAVPPTAPARDDARRVDAPAAGDFPTIGPSRACPGLVVGPPGRRIARRSAGRLLRRGRHRSEGGRHEQR